MTSDELVLEPCQGYKVFPFNAFLHFLSKSTKLTFVETLADFILSVRITHLHMLVVISQLVYALLAERHQEHIYRDTCDSVILRLDVSVLPFRSMSFWFALPALELAGIWQWL